MQRIEIHNFRQIADANIQVNDVTVLIGEQASGKSTIAKLVYFFKSLRKDLVEMTRVDPEEINGLKIKNRVRDKFYLYFGSTAKLADDYSVRFFFGEHQFIDIQGKPLDVTFSPQRLFNNLESEVRRAAVLVNHYMKRENVDAIDREERMLDYSLSEMLEDSRIPLYIPAGRNVTVSYTDEFLELFREMVKVKMEVLIGTDGLPKRQDAEEIDLILLRDFILHSSQLRKAYKGLGMDGILREIEHREALSDCILKLLKARYRYSEARGEYLSLGTGITGISRELRKASSGQQEAIRIVQDIILQIANHSPVFRVIEEPEAHLFPSGQHRMMEILAALVNTPPQNRIGGNNQLFLTTHSPYLLTILNNLIVAGDLSEETGADEALSDAGIPEIFRLKPSQVSAYMLSGDGHCQAMNDTAQGDFSANATGMISGNLLENYWNELQNQFDELLEIGA